MRYKQRFYPRPKTKREGRSPLVDAARALLDASEEQFTTTELASSLAAILDGNERVIARSLLNHAKAGLTSPLHDYVTRKREKGVGYLADRTVTRNYWHRRKENAGS